MQRMKRLGIFGALALSLALTPLAACGTSAYYVDGGEVWVDRAPPPPRFDRRPAMPGAGYVWVDGYWYWTGGGYVWRTGFWDRPPMNGHIWVASGWVFHNGRYRYVPGRWSAPRVAPRHNYVTRPLPAAYRPVRPGQRVWNHRNRTNSRGNARPPARAPNRQPARPGARPAPRR
jgi:hypothetical protein